MQFTKEQIKKFAFQARLDMPQERLDELEPDLNAIMKWAEMLNEVDVSGVEPLFNPSDFNLPMRDDVVKMENDRHDILRNAPDAEEGFYLVPKVVK